MNMVTRLRNAGRSWTEIKKMTGMSVAQAKREVEPDKLEARKALSRSGRNENARGLNDVCYGRAGFARCGHLRKEHVDGECFGCREYLIARGASVEEYQCEGFTDKTEPRESWLRHPNDVNQNLASHGVRVQGTWGGRGRRAGYLGAYGHADMQVPTAKRVLARLRRKAARKSGDS